MGSPAPPRTSPLSFAREISSNILLLIVGSMLCALAVNGILIPKHFLSAGFTGLSLGLHYLFPVLPLWALYLVLNIPLFVIGWMFVGKRFFFYSIAGMAVYSAALGLVMIPLPVHDRILSALLAGIINGTGTGIILRSYGCDGGTDLLSVIIMERFSIRLGSTILAFNSTILIAGAFLVTIDSVLYTLIFLYVNARVIDLVVSGLNKRKAVFIISSHWKEIAHEITHTIHRGVTILRGSGGYSGNNEHILYGVITFREISRLKKIAQDIDPHVFFVVSETIDVIGHRIGNQPHW